MEQNDKVLFGVMTIIFNAIGVPQFMRGKGGEGAKHIILSIVTCGICGLIYEIKGIIEGIRILKLSDDAYMAEKAADLAKTPAVDPNASFADKAKAAVNDAVNDIVDDAKDLSEDIKETFDEDKPAEEAPAAEEPSEEA